MINRLAFWTLLAGAAAPAGAFVPSTAILPAATSSTSPTAAATAAASATASRRRRGCEAVMMASSVAPAPRTKAEKKSEHFKLKEGGVVEFGSGQRVEVRRVGGCSPRKSGLIPGVWCALLVVPKGEEAATKLEGRRERGRQFVWPRGCMRGRLAQERLTS